MLYWPRCWVLYLRSNLQLLLWSTLKKIMKIQYTIYNSKIKNTFFKHKPIHLTTWQSPVPYFNITDCKSNTHRISSFRNQIYYILVRNNTNAKVFDSKATILTTTNSNHKPVIVKIMIKWKYQSKTKSWKKRFTIYDKPKHQKQLPK